MTIRGRSFAIIASDLELFLILTFHKISRGEFQVILFVVSLIHFTGKLDELFSID